MNPVAIIPARYASTRLPGKPLLDLGGKPVIQHVYERARDAGIFSRVLVATDTVAIYKAVVGFGGEAVMTSTHHRSGTERIAEVARNLDASCVMNIQGDEPFVQPRMLAALWQGFQTETVAVMGTLRHPLGRYEDVANPNVVKVVTDEQGYALYFSRAPVPHATAASFRERMDLPAPVWFKHVGVYIYRRDFLLQVPSLSPSLLEEVESLEQLRVLERGFRIRVYTTAWETLGIDTEADLLEARRRLSAPE